MATQDDKPNLKIEFEKLDRLYSRSELLDAHTHAALIQLAKAAPDERQRLCERYLSDLGKWAAWANELAPIFHEKLDW
jgi:hypothetical protein